MAKIRGVRTIPPGAQNETYTHAAMNQLSRRSGTISASRNVSSRTESAPAGFSVSKTSLTGVGSGATPRRLFAYGSAAPPGWAPASRWRWRPEPAGAASGFGAIGASPGGRKGSPPASGAGGGCGEAGSPLAARPGPEEEAQVPRRFPVDKPSFSRFLC